MKIRSLLLGSVAAAGLSTGGAFAADLGVLPSFDICDELGITGLTISSESDCLVITGGVEYTFTWGDYTGDGAPHADGYVWFDNIGWDSGDGEYDWGSELDAWLQFAATSSTDFGKAKAVIKITNGADEVGYDSYSGGHYDEGVAGDLGFDEAYVSIGDTTVITAGKTGSIINLDDDEPLDWLGGFISEGADTGVGYWSGYGDFGGGLVIQATHDLGNGFSISGGLEELNNGDSEPLAAGVLSYSGDGISAHISVVAIDILHGDFADDGLWGVHAGFAGEFDNFKVVLAGAYGYDNDSGESLWNVLASASATFDIFTLAASVEALQDPDEDDYYGVSGSISAEVTDGVSLNLGGRYLNEYDGDDVFEVAAGVTADVTETLEASAKVGFVDDSWQDLFYGEAGLTWKPGGNYEAGITGSINSDDAYSIETTFKKEFK
jgi:hypothetical protein